MTAEEKQKILDDIQKIIPSIYNDHMEIFEPDDDTVNDVYQYIINLPASLSSLEGEKIKGWIYSDEQLPDFNEVTDLAVIRRSDNEIFTWRFEKGYTWNPENFKDRFSRWIVLPKPPVNNTNK